VTAWGRGGRSSHRLAFGVVAAVAVAGGLAALGILYWRSSHVVARAETLPVGTCIRATADRILPEKVEVARCDRPHFGEVFAVLTVPDALVYPGEVALMAFGDNCGPEFLKYAPNSPEGPTFRVAVSYPSTTAWATGDRSFVCAAMSKHERWSSVRG
jgi:hypothetical protein